jgi:uncharacterized Zn-binding protein involved in type VI secretion
MPPIIAACVGDLVAGAAPPPNLYAGNISLGSATVLFSGKPAAYVGSQTIGTMTVPSPAGPVPTPGTPGVIGTTAPCTVLISQ